MHNEPKSRSADDLRKMLAKNAVLTEQSHKHQAKIRKSARSELVQVNARLERLTAADTLTDEVKAHEYRGLIEDRARLLRIGGTEV